MSKNRETRIAALVKAEETTGKEPQLPQPGAPTGMEPELPGKRNLKPKYGRDPKTYTLKEAQEKLEKEGFQPHQDGMLGYKGEKHLYVYKHPMNGQRVNLAHQYSKNGQDTDEATITYHSAHPVKRRSPEKKYRDNFVLYD